jgi:hypothetical protein
MDEQPMTINGRLLLLVVATGVFVRVWSANDQSRSRPVMRTQSQTAVACPPNPEPVTSGTAAMYQPVSATVSVAATAEEAWTVADCPIPLPAGITAGSYRVVDDTGRVARIEIGMSDSPVADVNLREVPAGFHVSSVGARRWYFIRLQTPTATEMSAALLDASSDAARETASEPCRFQNRKFDFTGYLATSELDDTSTSGQSINEEIARPDPPELPVPR